MTTWLVLMHQLPPKPDYLRVKIGRRLQRIGAVALKNTVYLLPANDSTLEDMQWTAREIRQSGGEANLCRAEFIDGLTDAEIQQRFNAARDAEYAPLLEDARRKRASTAAIRERMAPIKALDFFEAPNGQALEARLRELERPMRQKAAGALNLTRRVWVTRAGIHVDRMASAWLIRRFIDPHAKFRFVTGNHKRAKNEIRFDMFDAEFTHEGDRCTFEVLVSRSGLGDPALTAIGEMVHDMDLRDDKFARQETAGFAMVINGIALANSSDEERLRRASEVFEGLYRSLSALSSRGAPPTSAAIIDDRRRGRRRPT